MVTPRKALLLVTIVLLCCALLKTSWTSWLIRPLQNTVDAVQWPAGWLAAKLKTEAPFEGQDLTLSQLEKQNRELRQYNSELWAENEKLKEQIESFKAIALVRDLKTIRPVEAYVASFNNDPVNPTMKLLRGSLHGIRSDDAVSFKTNLIGFVREVGPVTCVVSVITGPSFRSEVAIMPPSQLRAGNNWPVIARAESDGKGRFIADLSKEIASYLRAGDVVRINDTLRESANGFVLGDIESIEPHPNRPLLESRVLITPRTPIGRQAKVTVITERTD